MYDTSTRFIDFVPNHSILKTYSTLSNKIVIIYYFYIFQVSIPPINVEAIQSDLNDETEIVAEPQNACITNNEIDMNVSVVTPTSLKRIKTTNGLSTNKISKIDTSLDNVVEILKLASTQKATINEFTIFGNHVAAQLEKLPLQQAVVIQEQIQSILTKARLNNLSRPLSPVSNVTSQS